MISNEVMCEVEDELRKADYGIIYRTYELIAKVGLTNEKAEALAFLIERDFPCMCDFIKAGQKNERFSSD